jgi:hypothetical protein
MSTPEALRLADVLDADYRGESEISAWNKRAIVAELRRQHAEIERLTAERDKATREAAEWRENFASLQRALVGETGASGITVAAALRKDAERYAGRS